MSLDDFDSVDAIGIDKESGDVVLTIIDHWDWSEEGQHLRALQEKINSYFGFVESGQIYKQYPDANGKALCIDVVSKYQMPGEAIIFLSKAAEVAKELNIKITNRVHFS